MNRYSDYDSFAWIYNKHWGHFGTRVIPILERLILKDLPSNAHILDLCCGTGQLAKGLSAQGYTVIGVDGSEEMISIARENAPEADFIVEDARSFSISESFHGVVSTFDSLNHVMTLRDLVRIFHNVYAALLPGGIFEFDLNMEAGYKTRWQGSDGYVEDDHACIVRANHQPEERIGQTEITMFVLMGDRWERSDLTLLQRWYSESEIEGGLKEAGFEDVEIYDGGKDLGEELSRYSGRSFFVGRKTCE